MRRKPFRLLGLVLLLGLSAIVFQTLIKAGSFKSIKNEDGTYEVAVLSSPPGVEDLDFDPESQNVFLSSQDRRNKHSGGAIYALNIIDPEAKPVNLTAHLNLKEFRPHGISFLNFNGQKLLFVISHRDSKDVVMKFLYENDSLFLENSYSSTDFTSPNDLVAVGENAFFLTNDHGDTRGWKRKFSDYLRLPVGNVAYFQDGKSTIVLDKIAYPNGITVLNDLVYVSSTLGNYIAAHKPVSSNYHLEEVKKISTPHAPDNLIIFQDRIYTAAHPKLLAFSNHAVSSEKKSPSAVYFLENDQISEIFLDDGNRLSGSSTALPYTDSTGKTVILVGSVYENKILKLSPK